MATLKRISVARKYFHRNGVFAADDSQTRSCERNLNRARKRSRIETPQAAEKVHTIAVGATAPIGRGG